MNKYDLIVVGSGPGGLAAAIYAARYNLKTLVLYKTLGGEVSRAPKIENYLGFKSITGYDLITKMKDQADYLNIEMKEEEVLEIKKDLTIKTREDSYKAKALVLSMGLKRKALGIPGEEEFEGKGVSYCVVCDVTFYKDKEVAVIGGNKQAVRSALLLSKYCKKVYIVNRGKEFTAEPIDIEKITNSKKIELLDKNIKAIKGYKIVNEMCFDDKTCMPIDGIFIEAGMIPSTAIISKLGLKLNKKKEVIVNTKQETNVPGIFAAGDMTDNPFKQISTAVGQGAMAAFTSYRYIYAKK